MSKRSSKPSKFVYLDPVPRGWDLRRTAKRELNRILSSRKMREEHRRNKRNQKLAKHEKDYKEKNKTKDKH